MNEIICYTHYLPEGEEKYISFMELLLDDNWADGNILCPDEVYAAIGNTNTRLNAKQNYEFLLRAIKKYPLKAIGAASSPNEHVLMEDNEWESFRTDCYIAGKYQSELLESGFFNPVMETLLTAASELPASDTAVLWLEKMISHDDEYFKIDDNTRPILIYLGDDTCYHTLNAFALELANSLLAQKQRIEIFDMKKEGNQTLTKYIGQRFKAIVGIQTYVFSIMMQDKTTNLHDLIIGPKFNMILDHPAWMLEHLLHAPQDYYLLTHDRNYVTFAKKYYKNIKDCIYLPPAGTLPTDCPVSPVKCYDLTFIGSYHDYRERLTAIATYERKYRFLAARFIAMMRKYPNYPAEKALEETLKRCHIILNEQQFLGLFFDMRQCCFAIMLYYREKIIRTLLETDIEVHVYGQTWRQAPYADHPCLIHHPEAEAKESLEIMKQSKLSLNIMSWHKDGLTERVLNAMLCRSAVISDRSTALEDNFVNGEDLILFDLTNLNALPALVKNLLSDNSRLEKIAENGFQKARQQHLWEHRAKQLLDVLD